MSDWTDDAECRGQEPDLFFSHGNGQAKAMVKQFCGRCTVINYCRERWLSMPYYDQRYGVWFGTTPNQRARNTAGVRPA